MEMFQRLFLFEILKLYRPKKYPYLFQVKSKNHGKNLMDFLDENAHSPNV